MEMLELPTGVYDLQITLRPEDLDVLEKDGVLEKFDCDERFYKHELFGQLIGTCHLEEVYIDEVIKILMEKNIESDIEIFPFFQGDEVIKNAYTRQCDGEMKSFSNDKTAEGIALEMTKLLKVLDNLGQTESRDVILANINQFHSIGFIANPLDQPQG